MMKISTTKPVKATEELASQASQDKYAFVSTVNQKLDELVLFYKQLKSDVPEWEKVLDQQIDAVLKQKGAFAALLDTISETDAVSIETGEETARDILNEGCSFDEPELFADCGSSCCYPAENTEAIITLIDGNPSVTEDIDDDSDDDILVKGIDDALEVLKEKYSDLDIDYDQDGEAGVYTNTFYADGEQVIAITDAEIYDSIPEETADAVKDYIVDKVSAAISGDDYIILAKESDDPDEAFLEYHYPDILMARGSFLSANCPVALLSKKEGKWVIEEKSEECSEPDLAAMLDEQIELLNS